MHERMMDGCLTQGMMTTDGWMMDGKWMMDGGMNGWMMEG